MDQLIRLMRSKVNREGARGKSALAMAIDRGERMIERYLSGQSHPRPEIAHKLAVACGCSDQEAQIISDEASIQRAKVG